MKKKHTIYYVNSRQPLAAVFLGQKLCDLLTDMQQKQLVFFCIGSSRIIGDTLGPLVGSLLSLLSSSGQIFVYGTLDTPIHAKNMRDAFRQIKKKHPHCILIAVDASLGIHDHIGYITLGKGPLRPGAGVKKRLPSIGDIYITGIICSHSVSASQDTLLPEALVNADPVFVSSLAQTIAAGILYALDLSPEQSFISGFFL